MQKKTENLAVIYNTIITAARTSRALTTDKFNHLLIAVLLIKSINTIRIYKIY